MERSWGSFISVSMDLTEAVSHVAATVVGLTGLVGPLDSSMCIELEGRQARPSLVGKTDNGLEAEVFKGCLGEPNRSSRRALGCKSWGCSANGMGSEVAKGSGEGQPITD